MICDTCCCGASFTATARFSGLEISAHAAWLAAHAACREKSDDHGIDTR